MRTLATLLVAAALALAADISGTWNFTVETDAGSGNPVFVLKQDGDKVSGTYTGALGEAKVAGTVKGDQVELSFEVEGAGAVKYSGKLDGATRMKGTLVLGTLGKGTFTATKQ